jgi:membrane-bound metal-dependent hydrolase YbcI (DUF457 family)
MPDLLTHLAAAHIVRRTGEISRCRVYRSQDYTMFYLGSILPDLIVRPLSILFDNQSVYWFFSPTHFPLVLVLMSYVIVMFFKESSRKKFFLLLMLGNGLHCVLDVLQKNIALEGYYWFFPFSWKTFSLQLFWPSDSILAIPFLLVIIVVLEIFFFRKSNKRGNDQT